MAVKGNNQKSLTVSEVTVDRILSHYLWNSHTPPKPEDRTAVVTDTDRDAIKIDAADYMRNGAGRYASAANFKVLRNSSMKKDCCRAASLILLMKLAIRFMGRKILKILNKKCLIQSEVRGLP